MSADTNRPGGPGRSPLRELSVLLQGVLDQIDNVARTEERLADTERRLAALEKRLQPHGLTAEEQIELSVSPPVLAPDRPEADIEPPERPGDDYQPAKPDLEAIHDLERRAAEALGPHRRGSDGFDGVVRRMDGVVRAPAEGAQDTPDGAT